jgi:TolB-like protein/cytochrome c-type biogenesis protein CcmH/NrfG
MESAGGKTFLFSGYRLDLRRGSLSASDCEIALRPKSFEVLRYLVENAGRLVPKDELISTVWPNVAVADEALARCVSDVRSALNDNDQSIIKTIPRRGYLFTATVSLDGISRDSVTAGPIGIAMRPAPPFSLVVLPFVSLSGDPAHNNLADVITEGLTSFLSRIRDAFVIARSTALTYKGKAVDARLVGRELGVRYVLEGSEQRSGDRIRVSAQLIDVETGAHLWADRFDAEHADALQTQDEIVTRLSRAVQIELASVEAARIFRTRSADLGAEELALRGEAIFLRYGPSRDHSETAFELCERALKIEPNNVRALSILVERYATRVTGMQSVDREADTRRAEDLASRALAADPNSYHARHAKARTLIARKRAEEAIIEAERSLRLNPGYIPTYLDLCQANLMLGLPDKTIENADRAMRLSPPDPYLYVFYAQQGLGYIMLGYDQRALASLRRAVANNPEFPTPLAYLAAMLALTGERAEARETLKRYLSLPRTKSRTIADWTNMGLSDHPAYLALRRRINEGLHNAGLPEK